jgi:enamine deaminase RidA (YjgF/YER057c/UK114 family)
MTTERQRVKSGSPFEATIGFSRAVRVGERVLVSGTGPIWADGSFDPDPAAQARRCLEIVVAGLLDPRWRVESRPRRCSRPASPRR